MEKIFKYVCAYVYMKNLNTVPFYFLVSLLVNYSNFSAIRTQYWCTFLKENVIFLIIKNISRFPAFLSTLKSRFQSYMSREIPDSALYLMFPHNMTITKWRYKEKWGYKALLFFQNGGECLCYESLNTLIMLCKIWSIVECRYNMF